MYIYLWGSLIHQFIYIYNIYIYIYIHILRIYYILLLYIYIYIDVCRLFLLQTSFLKILDMPLDQKTLTKHLTKLFIYLPKLLKSLKKSQKALLGVLEGQPNV